MRVSKLLASRGNVVNCGGWLDKTTSGDSLRYPVDVFGRRTKRSPILGDPGRPVCSLLRER